MRKIPHPRPLPGHLYQALWKSVSATPVLLHILLILLLPALASCSVKRFLKPGETLLSKAEITSSEKNLKTTDYRRYLNQHPNNKWFSLFNVPLRIYCLSKADSVKGRRGFSKILRNIGEAPVVYDPQLTAYSMESLRGGLESEGYLRAAVDTSLTRKGIRTKVEYRLTPGPRYYIHKLDFHTDDASIYPAFRTDSAHTLLRRGMPLNLNTLSEERTRIIHALRNRGYYYLNNDFITYDIDTIPGSLGANVTLRLAMPMGADSTRAYRPQRFHKVSVVEDISPDDNGLATDSTLYRHLWFLYHQKQHINKRVFVYHVGQRPDSLYSETALQNTYGTLNALPAINYTSVRIQPAPEGDSLLDCRIHIQRNKPHSIGMELEGTNTAGDLGAAVACTYSNKNIFGGAELFSLKARMAYEAITGLEGYANQNYVEWSAEANLRFPTLLLPFVSINSKRRFKATSEAQFMYDTQNRPEFHRRVLTGTWAYNWTRPERPKWKHRFDLFSINYVFMPWISSTFSHDYLEGDDPHYSVLRYSYENLFIMKTGYSFTYNSRRDGTGQPGSTYQTNGFQVKVGFEFAGNILYALSKSLQIHQGNDGSYKIFGIAYSQYAKIDFDFAKSVVLTEKSSVAFHAALGLGLPYGNSTILPYEKRYFAGGANSVRGWSVRGLGPGAYKGKDGKVDFINQTGNLKLDLNMEWRTFLFWKIHSAFFIDAGNVWNTRAYADMDGAQFKWNKFYKQIAVAYGIGFRLNFDYFILRLDGGMKAIDPAVPHGRLHYPISKPDFGRDFTLHFAVGLPF